MALPSVTETYNSMYTATARNISKKVKDQTFTKYPLFYKLIKDQRVSEEGGISIQRPVSLVQDTSAQFFGRGASFNSNDPDFFTKADYAMKNLGASLTRYWEDERVNTGKSQIIRLVSKNMEKVLDGMRKKAWDSLWAATPAANAFNSLPYYVSSSPTTGTVAGIDRAAYSLWRNYVLSCSGQSAYTTLLDNLFKARLNIEKYGKVDYAICDSTSFELLNAITREQKYITEKSMGDAEFQNFQWQGLTFTLDFNSAISSGTIYLLDMSSWEFVNDPAANFTWTEWKAIPNSLDLEGQCVFRGQVICDALNKNGVLTGIAA